MAAMVVKVKAQVRVVPAGRAQVYQLIFRTVCPVPTVKNAPSNRPLMTLVKGHPIMIKFLMVLFCRVPNMNWM